MSSLEDGLRVLTLFSEADAIRNRIVSEYGVADFDNLPPEGYEEFDLLMAAAGWAVKTKKASVEATDD